MAPKIKSLVKELSRRGPHRVLRGDLAFAGLPGIVCTPEEGLNLPAVAFGHDWLRAPQRYLDTLAHLASWGIVAAAPATQRGPVPSHVTLAADLRTTLDICTGVRLGTGNISVRPDRVALAGHGMGGGAAVLAAARYGQAAGDRADKVAAVAALFPSPTSPSGSQVAGRISAPGLILDAPEGLDRIASDAVDLAHAWGGDSGAGAVLRTVDKASDAGLAEGGRSLKLIGLPRGDRATQRATRALLTGFLLFHLTGEGRYEPFADADAEIPKTTVIDPAEHQTSPETRLGKIFHGQ